MLVFIQLLLRGWGAIFCYFPLFYIKFCCYWPLQISCLLLSERSLRCSCNLDHLRSRSWSDCLWIDFRSKTQKNYSCGKWSYICASSLNVRGRKIQYFQTTDKCLLVWVRLFRKVIFVGSWAKIFRQHSRRSRDLRRDDWVCVRGWFSDFS